MSAAAGAGGVGAWPSGRRLREIAHQFFRIRDPATFDALLRDLELVRVPGGIWLFRGNDLGDSLFLIVRGRLQVWREGAGDEARDGARSLRELSAGQEVSRSARWIDAVSASELHHLREGSMDRDLARLARVLAGEALGLLLGGGGARGFAHIGAFRALREAGIEVDLVEVGYQHAREQIAKWGHSDRSLPEVST